jgi:hypothetical protein
MTLEEKMYFDCTLNSTEDAKRKAEVAEEFAIEFADWINSVSYRSFDGNWYLTKNDEDIKKTTEELLEIYKKEKEANTCQYCGSENGNHKLSCPVIRITMLL